MNVLVCDDDVAARFVASRWLTGTLGCNVTTCEDGVAALKLLADKPFDLALIDLDLPRLTGLEIVEAIRSTEATRDLPVVILTQERREEVIRKLMALGVSAYLLKPLRERAVLGRIGPLLASRRSVRVRPANLRDVLIGPDNPVLIADGDQNFRHTFTSVASQYGPVITADSGAEALANFRNTPVSIVFIGAELGIIGPDRLVKKLREVESQYARLVGVGIGPDHEHRALFDDVIPRAFVPDVLAEALQLFVPTVGSMAGLEQLAPQFAGCLTSAVVQVLGMMGGVEVAVGTSAPPAPGDGLVSTVAVDVNGRFTLDVDLALPAGAVRELTMRILGVPEDGVDAEAASSTTSELANMISGRLDAWLKGRNLACHFSLPATRPATVEDWTGQIPAGEGASAWFGMPELSQHLRLTWRARENPAPP